MVALGGSGGTCALVGFWGGAAGPLGGSEFVLEPCVALGWLCGAPVWPWCALGGPGGAPGWHLSAALRGHPEKH